MLVLSRKPKETIIINGNIKVTVVEVRGDKVRLGIEAPLSIDVHRKEVFERLYPNKENKDEDNAASGASSDTGSSGAGSPSTD